MESYRIIEKKSLLNTKAYSYQYYIFVCLFSTRQDSLVELTELVHKGERKGLFQDKMPVSIQQVVRDENLQFMKNKDIYDQYYFDFLLQLTDRNTVSLCPNL